MVLDYVWPSRNFASSLEGKKTGNSKEFFLKTKHSIVMYCDWFTENKKSDISN
jgi:hypothetical protein